MSDCQCNFCRLGRAHHLLTPFAMNLICHEPELAIMSMNVIYMEFELRELKKMERDPDVVKAIDIFERSIEKTISEAVERMKKLVGRD